MKEEELNALERDAKALRDPKLREEALKALAELKAAQSNFELEKQSAARVVPRPPDFKNYSIGKFVRLLFGVAVFFALCISLMSLVLPIGRLLAGDISGATFALLMIIISAIAVSAMTLYLLSRKAQKERETLERNPIAKQFAKQKLLFQISALGLLVLTVFSIIFTASVIQEHRATAYVMSGSFLFAYWLLGRKFWRCPGCGTRLSFMTRYTDRQSVQKCSTCHATLQ